MTTDPTLARTMPAANGAAQATVYDHLRSLVSSAEVAGARLRLDLTEMPFIGSSTFDEETTRFVGKVVKAALASQPPTPDAASAVDDGWFLLPKDYTEAMQSAFERAYSNKYPEEGDGSFGSGYRAMLAAGPMPAPLANPPAPNLRPAIEALQFYARGSEFGPDDDGPRAWDGGVNSAGLGCRYPSVELIQDQGRVACSAIATIKAAQADAGEERVGSEGAGDGPWHWSAKDGKPRRNAEYGERYLQTWSEASATYDIACIDGDWSHGEEIDLTCVDAWRWLSFSPAAPPAPAAGDRGQMERVRHVKRGTEYEVVGEAEGQVAIGGYQIRPNGADPSSNAASITARLVHDGSLITVYRCTKTGKLWFRFTNEFRDGRFVPTSPIAEPEPRQDEGAK